MLITERTKQRMQKPRNMGAALGGGGGGTPLCGLYRNMCWTGNGFLPLCPNREYNFRQVCPKQGLNLSETG